MCWPRLSHSCANRWTAKHDDREKSFVAFMCCVLSHIPLHVLFLFTHKLGLIDLRIMHTHYNTHTNIQYNIQYVTTHRTSGVEEDSVLTSTKSPTKITPASSVSALFPFHVALLMCSFLSFFISLYLPSFFHTSLDFFLSFYFLSFSFFFYHSITFLTTHLLFSFLPLSLSHHSSSLSSISTLRRRGRGQHALRHQRVHTRIPKLGKYALFIFIPYVRNNRDHNLDRRILFLIFFVFRFC